MRIFLPGSRRRSAQPPSHVGEAGVPAPHPPAIGPALLRTYPGRALIVTSAMLSALLLVRSAIDLPPVIDVFRRVVWIVWFVSAAGFLILTLARHRRGFLWRVRQKLLLSYVFLGVVPVALVMAFAAAAGVLLYITVAAYVFQEGYGDEVDDIRQIAETLAIEAERSPEALAARLNRRVESLGRRYPALSLAIVPVSATFLTAAATVSGEVAVAGRWAHARPPAAAPAWFPSGGRGVAGTIALAGESGVGGVHLVIRAAVPVTDGRRIAIADLPVDGAFVERLHQRTGIRLGAMHISGCGADGPSGTSADEAGQWAVFERAVGVVACTNWATGDGSGRVSVNLVAPVSGLYARLASANAPQIDPSIGDSWGVLLQVLGLLGVLFLIIQGSALVIGAVLAKSITSVVHELFEGTERVQQGDFTHRIRIESRDQLGELAGSFNRMSESIEHLLVVQREKQRLDDELRIAREIQKSLLPVHPPTMAGLDIADLCEPAREVGGDYYDFFEIGPRQLGVLIADVSGKGTSAALYMAELKGLMLALSHTSPSPRQLLIEVNRRLSGQLDHRSFITMTYLVIDLERRTLTASRAGHTPLVVVSRGESEVITPAGMVLGLRLPGAETRFETVLAEYTRPIVEGDVIVLYTDGITEAMDAAGEMFGDAALTRVLSAHQLLSAAALRERVVRDVRAFVGEAEPHDDMTLVVLKIAPEPA